MSVVNRQRWLNESSMVGNWYDILLYQPYRRSNKVNT
jgi:hypothetical protein